MPRPLHERFGALPEVVQRTGLYGQLPDPLTLLRQAYEVGPSDPDASRVYLAAAMLSASERTDDGRLAAVLKIASRITAAYSSPQVTLGPKGDELRDDVMPGGWMSIFSSWERFRYAWLKGLDVMLNAERDVQLEATIDELVRMDSGEKEPIRVHIQKTWPPSEVTLVIGVLGVSLSLWSLRKEIKGRR